MIPPERNVQREADQLLKTLEEGLGPTDAATVAATVAWRASVELQRIANVEMRTRQGQSDWGAWARLRNAARKLVLESSTARDEARELAKGDD